MAALVRNEGSKMTGGTNLKTWVVISVFLLGMGCTAASGRTIYVDNYGTGDFNNIQAAINDANNGDTIIVADGIYTGDGNRDIDFNGKAITVGSANGPENCIIDCNGTSYEPHRGFRFVSGEDANSGIIGFTITNGYAPLIWVPYCCPFGWEPAWPGGGIFCHRSSPTITNCTITGNQAIGDNPRWDGGGGIACHGTYGSSNPTITNCTFSGNSSSNGGGIGCWWDSNPTLTNCTFIGNAAGHKGGGIACWGWAPPSSPTLANCTFVANSAHEGGGMHNGYSSPTLTNCTFSGNVAQNTGGAVANDRYSNSTFTNCTFSGNKAPNGNALSSDLYYGKSYPSDIHISNCILWDGGSEIWNNDNSVITITYSDVQAGWPGEGNIDVDPCFAEVGYWDPNGTPTDINDDFWVDGDYHLKSQAGRWEPSSPSWVQDEVTSPCIDAGDIDSPIGLEPFPNGGRVNMGAYGGTAEASKSYFGEPICETIVSGDINGDCIVNFKDFALMALHWLRDENQ